MRLHVHRGTTHPPLNAPTGFFTGGATTSCSCDRVVWNDLIGNLVAGRALVKAVAREAKSLEAMAVVVAKFVLAGASGWFTGSELRCKIE